MPEIKKRLSWKNKDHIFTSINITIDEKLSAQDINACIYKGGRCKFKPRAQRKGKVTWIIKGGIEQ